MTKTPQFTALSEADDTFGGQLVAIREQIYACCSSSSYDKLDAIMKAISDYGYDRHMAGVKLGRWQKDTPDDG